MGFSKAFSLLSENQAAPQQGTWGRRGWETDSTDSIPLLSHQSQGNAEAWLSPSPPPSRASRWVVNFSTSSSALEVHSSGSSPLENIDRGETLNEIPISPQGLSEPQLSLEVARSLGELHSEATCILATCLCLRTVTLD